MRNIAALFILLAITARAQMVSYGPAPSSSVVTNPATVYTNDFTSNPFSGSNWFIQVTGKGGVGFDGGGSIRVQTTNINDAAIAIWSNATAYSSDLWTFYGSVTNAVVPFGGHNWGLYVFLSGTQQTQQAIGPLAPVSSLTTNWVRTYTGSWDEARISFQAAENGASTQFWGYFSFANAATITTNSSSGSAGAAVISVGPSFTGVTKP